MYVTAKAGLTIREKPDKGTTALAVIRYGSPVSVLEDTDRTATIEGRTAPWVHVRHGDGTGYAFGGFLSGDPPTVQVMVAISPGGSRRLVLENAGLADLPSCQDHYSATCVLKVLEGETVIYEHQGDGPVRWISETGILLRSDIGDAGITGSTFSILDVLSGKTTMLCNFGTAIPIEPGTEKGIKRSYSICDSSMECDQFIESFNGVLRHERLLQDGKAMEVDEFQSIDPQVGFDGNQCWFTSGSRRYSVGNH